MPFNSLILSCSYHKTSFTDNGLTISVKKKADETVLFFPIDNDINTLKNDIKIGTGPICDLIVFYSGDNPTICFVELKGTDLKRATTQIVNTYKKFNTALIACTSDRKCKRCLDRIVWKAYVLVHGSSPIPKDMSSKESLKKLFGKHFQIAHQKEIDSFLRN
jgi:hypothetical protein